MDGEVKYPLRKVTFTFGGNEFLFSIVFYEFNERGRIDWTTRLKKSVMRLV